MNSENRKFIVACKAAALKVLLHNVNGPFESLPRTAGWGYPEPYTRDLMISILGIAVTENQTLIESMRIVLDTLAKNQTEKGHIPSLVHDSKDLGASDTTPLFLMAVAIFRKITGCSDFLEHAVKKAFLWLEYQNPSDLYLVAQQPTSDWRDEQWVMGYGLYVNSLVYIDLSLFGNYDRADHFRKEMERFIITDSRPSSHAHEGLAVKHKPYYALWSYKIYNSDRFDLLGNSLAILSGLASRTRAISIISWVEKSCAEMRSRDELKGGLAPNFFPYINPGDTDWRERYASFNLPGDYHNGGIWPFISAFYIAALVAVEHFSLAEQKLIELSHAIKKSRDIKVDFGFNEWLKAQNGQPHGQDWQTWSAALYLYAAECVESKKTPYFDDIRNKDCADKN